MKLQPSSDDLHQLGHRHMVGDQELRLVQHGQLLLPSEPLNDAGDLVRVLLANLLNILHTKSIASSLFEWFL